MSEIEVDKTLLEKFEQEIWNKIPHIDGDKIVNPTPLVDLTNDLINLGCFLNPFVPHAEEKALVRALFSIRSSHL